MGLLGTLWKLPMGFVQGIRTFIINILHLSNESEVSHKETVTEEKNRKGGVVRRLHVTTKSLKPRPKRGIISLITVALVIYSTPEVVFFVVNLTHPNMLGLSQLLGAKMGFVLGAMMLA